MKKILILLLIIFMMAACQNEEVPAHDPGCDISEPCGDELINANDNLKWPSISFDEAMEYWDDEAVILFYSFEDCPYCVEARPVLEEVLKDSDLPVYYVDVDRAERQDGQTTYDQTFAHFKDLIEGDKMLVPFVAFIKDGTTVYGHTATVDGHKPSEAKMTDEQIQELIGYYTEGLNLVK